MNKVYKLVWSKVRNCYVVVSELVKNHSKSKSAKTAITGGLMATVFLMVPVSCLAADLPQPNQPLVNSENAAGINSIALGNGVRTGANAQNAVAMGNSTEASGANSTAIGYATQASGLNSFAAGDMAIASGYGAIAMGDSQSEARNSFAAGNGIARGNYSTAIGFHTFAIGDESVSMGSMNQAEGRGSSAIGLRTFAMGNASTAMGYWSRAEGDESTAIGGYSVAKGKRSTALSGGVVEKEGENAVALGNGAVAKLSNTVALGSGSVADRKAGFEGYDARLNGISTQDNLIWKATANGIAVGSAANGITRQITGVAAGTEDTDAVNVAQLKAAQPRYYSVNSTPQEAASNYNNDGAKGENALAAGSYALAQKDSVAVGHKAQANDMRSVAIGMGAKTFSKADNQAAMDTSGGNTAIGYNAQAGAENQLGLATAVGKDTKATGWGSSAYGVGAEAKNFWSTALGNQSRANETKGVGGTAIGTSAKADEAYATAVGLGAEATGVSSLAAGQQAQAQNDSSIAIGASAIAGHSHSVALGDHSVTAAVVTTSSETIVDKTYVVAGTNPVGTVSIGQSGLERTITNVAAGRVSSTSTDAVNGSQLQGAIDAIHTVNAKADTNATHIANNTQAIHSISMSTNELSNRIGKLDNRVNKVGAGAAALAALHPLDYDPNAKWEFAAGVGNYKNAQAAAIGVFYRPNYDTMFSIGTTMGDNRNMFNAGVTLRFGQSSKYAKMSKAEMADKIEMQSQEISELKTELAEIKAMLNK